jgi:hypothetical protein
MECGNVKRVLKWTGIVLAVLAVVLAAALIFYLREPISHRFSLYPKQARAWQALRAERQELTQPNGWNEYKGVMHSHSEISHDSKVPFPYIANALKSVGDSFIFMSDHFVDGKADYSLQWKGLHDGVLFVRGFEMQEGCMPWGIPDNTVFDSKEEVPVLAKKIKELGGVLFYAHCEEPRQWDVPELTGMEIYNTHADIKNKSKQEWIRLGKEFVVNFRAYPDQVFRQIFTRLDDYISKWDELNLHRHITGIAGNDIHQNVGVVGYVTANGKFALRDTGHIDRTIKEFNLNPFLRLFLRAFFGPTTPNAQLFRIDMDPYERSARYVATHLLAKELTEASLLDALRNGRAFVGFDMIVDSTGFSFTAENSKGKVVMGESILPEPGLKLKAQSPVPCRFTLYHDGLKTTTQEGRSFEYQPTDTGKYRIEAEVNVAGAWTLWVFTNPIEVTDVIKH